MASNLPMTTLVARKRQRHTNTCTQEFQELWPQIDLVLDGGKIVKEETSQSRLGSTVINLAQEGKFTIIRDGRYIHLSCLVTNNN